MSEGHRPRDSLISYAAGAVSAVVFGLALGFATKAGYSSVGGAGLCGGLVVGGLVDGLLRKKFKLAWASFGIGLGVGIVGACALVGIARAENAAAATDKVDVQQHSLWSARSPACLPTRPCTSAIFPRLTFGP